MLRKNRKLENNLILFKEEKMKKALSILLTLAILLTILTFTPLSAGAENYNDDDYEDDYDDDDNCYHGFNYNITDNDTVTIRWYEGSEINIEIPSQIKGYPVTEIADDAFTYEGKYAESIIIPNTVTVIGENAFQNCSKLTNLTMPDSVKRIKGWAFSGCSALTSFHIPSGLRSISEGMLCGCSSLNEITIPSSVTEISGYAFGDCTSLKKVVISSNVQEIGENAFSNCTSLESITIPNSVRSIGSFAFYCCVALKSVTLPHNNYFRCIEDYTFDDCISLESITIPDTVQSINRKAFYECYGLKSVVLSSALTYIGMEAFQKCSSLESIAFPASLTEIDHFAFRNCTSLSEVTFDNTIQVQIGYNVFFDLSPSMNNVILPRGVNFVDVHYGQFASYEDFSFNPDFTIYGYKGTNAEEFAETHSIHFVDLDETPIVIPDKPILGDADGDGEVTILDATCVQRHLAELKAEVYIEEASDADEDGDVTILDATAIQRHLAELTTNENIGKPIKA